MESARLNNKEDMIARVYFNSKTGIGSIDRVLKAAKQQDTHIKREDVKRLLDKLEIRQRERAKHQNSFVPFAPLDEIQIDLADMTEEPYRYALIAIDLFSQFLHVVPLKSKFPEDTADAIDEVLTEIGHPRSVMVDSGGEFQHEFRERLKYYGVHVVVSRTPVIFAERVIRTLKEQIQLRKDSLGDKHWTEYFPDVLEQYNSTERVTTQMEPETAIKQSNADKVRERIQSKAKFNRKYPDLQIGDKVRVIRKAGKIREYKANFSAWNQAIYTIAGTQQLNGQTFFKLSGEDGEFMMHALLNIEDSLVLQNKATPIREGERGTVEQERVRPQLRPYAAMLAAELAKQPEQMMSSAAASFFLRSKPGYTAIDTGNFPTKGQFGRFTKMFSEFELTTGITGGDSNVRLKPQLAQRRLSTKTGPQFLSLLPHDSTATRFAALAQSGLPAGSSARGTLATR